MNSFISFSNWTSYMVAAMACFVAIQAGVNRLELRGDLARIPAEAMRCSLAVLCLSSAATAAIVALKIYSSIDLTTTSADEFLGWAQNMGIIALVGSGALHFHEVRNRVRHRGPDGRFKRADRLADSIPEQRARG